MTASETSVTPSQFRSPRFVICRTVVVVVSEDSGSVPADAVVCVSEDASVFSEVTVVVVRVVVVSGFGVVAVVVVVVGFGVVVVVVVVVGFGVVGDGFTPSSLIFLGGAIVSLFTLIVLYAIRKRTR